MVEKYYFRVIVSLSTLTLKSRYRTITCLPTFGRMPLTQTIKNIKPDSRFEMFVTEQKLPLSLAIKWIKLFAKVKKQ